ncbi:hypothetical protein INS49_003038 [Diaporthe citri]|uniref:uncharacterized protein n=1 Tax=Diaporthe citri TaxID=83186 RepID=UPI001C82698D|nr:uncharacterized protein INS49_003038 [Diaporthe citri]KAG6368822.1 hypothetical protein INS49_003038 [Diaporthe citri]
MASSVVNPVTDATREWYIPSPATSTSVLEAAFEGAALQFSKQAENHRQEFQDIKKRNKFEDVQRAIQDCNTRYEARKPDSKALKWLRQLSEKVVFYEGVVDVLIQQHPEAVSLIWGGIKLILLS